MAQRNPTSTRRKRFALLLAIGAPLALGLFVFWTLHHPTPRVIAPVAIDRNSLLPHVYSGPCINCHRIIEIGPAAINAGNMGSFRLTPIERQLLLAGQRVDVPGISQKLRIPAITRTHILPHDYVGVCSNCHVMLDVHPSREFMYYAMKSARQPLLGRGALAEDTARGGAIWDATRSQSRREWGFVTLIALVISALAMIVRRVELARAGEGSAERRRRRFASACLTIHEWSAAAFCAAAAPHWYYSDRGNNFLHVGLVVLGGLLVGGALLHHQVVSEGKPASPLLLLGQRFLFVVFVGLLVVGHLFVDFM